MKNTFMTKALAVVLSASMALSLSTATALTANAAANGTPGFVKKVMKVRQGEGSKNYKLNPKTIRAGWKIVNVTVGNSKVLTVKANSSKKSVKVTPNDSYDFAANGKEFPRTSTVAKVKVRKNSNKTTDKTIKIRAWLYQPKDAAPSEEPTKEEPKTDDEQKTDETTNAAKVSVTGAKLTTWNTVVLTFDGEVDDKLVSGTTTSISWEATTGGQKTATGAANSVKILADKKSAEVVYPYIEGVTYTFTFNSQVAGSASVTVGKFDVVKIEIKDQEAEAGVKYAVQYKLLAEDDVDVTTLKNTANTSVDFEKGTGLINWDTTATAPWVYFEEANKSTKVTIKYTGVTPNLEASANITSKMPEATAATGKFKDNLLKWYLGGTADTAYTKTAGGDRFRVVFWAEKEVSDYAASGFGQAVKYDDITVTSSDNNVVAFESDTKYADGKYFIFYMKPGTKPGKATVTVTAKETKGVYSNLTKAYTFTVTTKDKNEQLSRVIAGGTQKKTSNGTISNSGDVTFKPVNSEDEIVDIKTASITKVTFKPDNNGAEVSLYAGNLVASDMDDKGVNGGFFYRLDKQNDGSYKLIWSNLNAEAGTYSFELAFKGDNTSNGKTVTAKYLVAVEDVIEKVYGSNEPGEAALGQIEAKYKADDGVSVASSTISGNAATRLTDDAVKYKSLNPKFVVDGVKDLKLSDASCVTETGDLALIMQVQGVDFAKIDLTTNLSGFDAASAADLLNSSVAMGDKVINDVSKIGAYVTNTSSGKGTKYYNTVDGTTLLLGQNGWDDREYSTTYDGNVVSLGNKISLKNSLGNNIVFYSADSGNNTVAEQGTYKIYFTKGDDEPVTSTNSAKYLIAESTFKVDYTGLTIPKVHYYTSANADLYAVADVDMVRAVDGASVNKGTYIKSGSNTRINNDLSDISMYTTNNAIAVDGLSDMNRSEGDKIFNVVVTDYRGTGTDENRLWTGGATETYESWQSQGELIAFVITRTDTLTK